MAYLTKCKTCGSEISSEAKECAICGQPDPNSYFIVSVVYGDSNCIEVIKFKEYRDKILLKNRIGKLFVKFYYMFSPSISKWLKNKKFLIKFLKRILNFIYKKILVN
jgi:predicted amidophosphoribosyltransferase